MMLEKVKVISESTNILDTKNSRDCCYCPSFLIAVSGPYLTVLGAIYTSRAVIQPLTDTIFLGEPQDDDRVRYVVRIFRALEIGMAELDQSYRNLKMDPTEDRFFPYVREYQSNGQLVRFRYISSLIRNWYGSQRPNVGILFW